MIKAGHSSPSHLPFPAMISSANFDTRDFSNSVLIG
jgi:hypothetical protein